MFGTNYIYKGLGSSHALYTWGPGPGWVCGYASTAQATGHYTWAADDSHRKVQAMGRV